MELKEKVRKRNSHTQNQAAPLFHSNQIMVRWLICFLALFIISNISAYKILFTMFLPSKSHGILGEGMVRQLLHGGHEVTYISSFPLTPRKNLTVIDVSENTKGFLHGVCNIKKMMEERQNLQSLYVLMDLMINVEIISYNTTNMQKLLNDQHQNFDLIITDWVYIELNAGLAAIYDCPYIWFSSLEPHWAALRLIDEIPNPAYVSDATSNNAPPFTFNQRLEELMRQIYGSWSQFFYIASREEKLYQDYIVPHIRARNKSVPTLDELKYNASLMFGNSHVSLGDATRLPQNYIPIGGFHIETDIKPLPNDLQKIMDTSEHGVIYFSMGTNLHSEDMPEVLTQGLLKMFANLKETVIWKFESNLPNTPKNVHIVHWAPQQSILAHPKIVFFITHCGLLSTTEAIYFGVPMIAIPVMVDQFTNAEKALKKGYAIKVNLSYTMVKDLEQAIKTMLADPKYRAKAKELSFIYHNRPLKPAKEILYWVDLVVKTRGALHLRSPALHMPWYQKLYLDLITLILVILSVFIFVIKIILLRKPITNNKKKD